MTSKVCLHHTIFIQKKLLAKCAKKVCQENPLSIALLIVKEIMKCL